MGQVLAVTEMVRLGARVSAGAYLHQALALFETQAKTRKAQRGLVWTAACYLRAFMEYSVSDGGIV